MSNAKLPSSSQRQQPRLGPYSRKLQRGAIGDMYDGRSAEGRFVRHLEAELVRHVGGNPSITQRLLIDRLIKIRIALDLLDAKLAKGKWTPNDSRTHGGLLNGFRLACRELGLKPAAEKPKTLAEMLDEEEAEAGAAE